MERAAFVLLAAICLLMVGCQSYGVETDYAAAVMVEDTVYYLSVENLAEVDESAIIGYTDSHTDTFPEKNGQTNFNREIGMPYAKVENGIAVLYENEWCLCTPKDEDAGFRGGNISFYSETTTEKTDPVSVHTSSISKKQTEKLRAIFDNVDEWIDDHSIERRTRRRLLPAACFLLFGNKVVAFAIDLCFLF